MQAAAPPSTLLPPTVTSKGSGTAQLGPGHVIALTKETLPSLGMGGRCG